jgi:YVTN family beta-propeller protein
MSSSIPATSTRWRHRLAALATATALATGGLTAMGAPAYAAHIPEPLVYVADSNANTVSVLGATDQQILYTIPVGAGPQGLAIDPTGTVLYVANNGDGTVSVVNAVSNTVSATIAVGNGPLGIAITPDDTQVYVTNQNDNTVSVIDAATDTVTATIPVGSNPIGVVVNPSGTQAYVADNGSASMSVIDTATNTVSATFPVGNGPGVPAISPDGTTLYVANANDGTLSVINTAGDTTTATFPVGPGPSAVTLSPDGATAYVDSINGDSIAVVDTATDTVTTTVPVGYLPLNGAVSADGGTAYFANLGDNTVSVLDTATDTVTATLPGFSGARAVAINTVSAPVVTSVTPGGGPVAGGNTVTIDGNNLAGASAVTFGSAGNATNVSCTVISCTVTAPPGTTGTVDVQVFTVDGTGESTAADHYTYAAVPVVTSVSPSSGPSTGGNTVTITGTGFTGADNTAEAGNGITFGPGNFATNVSCTDTSCTVTAPPQAPAFFTARPDLLPANTVYVQVTTLGGTSEPNTDAEYTYEGAPTVTSISPTAGPLSAGTAVAITGTDLSGTTAITFGPDNEATSFSCTDDSDCTVLAPAGTVGTVDVVVTTPAGTSATSSADQYTYTAVPVVTGVSPSKGPLTGGNVVTVTGSNLVGATTVTFGTNAATGVSCTATSCTVTAPAGTAGAVDVQVTTPGGISPTSSSDRYTYTAAPIVTAISPTAGPLTAGTVVTVTGSNLTGATKVTFGSGHSATGVSCSATSCTVTAPAGTAGAVDVQVTTPTGTSATSAADKYTYTAVPTVTAVSPKSGPLTAGTSVKITGTGLSSATDVTFGPGKNATILSCTATSCTVTAPAGTAGPADVQVTTSGGTSATVAADQYTYLAVPVVTAIGPSAGPVKAGTVVTITGSGLTGATAVTFGAGKKATAVTCTAISCTATAPAGTAGTVDVQVTTPGGISATTSADQYTYTAAPVVAAVMPAAGPLAAGTVVTITGTGLSGATKILFGTVAATGVSCTATSCTATAPAGTAGMVNVQVTAIGGVSAAVAGDKYTYTAVPTVTAVSPITGPVSGGASVKVTGTNLASVTAVTFGQGNNATGISCTATACTVTAPAGSAGTVNVQVTSPGGTSATATGDQYTYAGAPVVTGISPSVGSTSGGTTVTITGANLYQATAVTFGGKKATITSCLPTTCIVTSPAGTVGTVVDVQVTTGAGTSATNSADQFTYAKVADVTAKLVGSASPVLLGNTYTYTATVTDTGTIPITGTTDITTLTGTADALISATPSQGSCTVSGATATCSLGNIAAAGKATVVLVVEPDATGSATATTTAGATQPDPNLANNTATVTTALTNGNGCTVIGTSGNDTIDTNSGTNVVCDLGGNDFIYMNGPGSVYLGSGTDAVSTEAVSSDVGNVTIYGNVGVDVMDFGTGPNNVVYAGDYLYPNAAPDTIYGNNTTTCYVTKADTYYNCTKVVLK